MTCPDCKGEGFKLHRGLLQTETGLQTFGLTTIDCPTCNGTGKYTDPWLRPGTVCLVWRNGTQYKETAFFLQLDNNGRPRFVDFWPYGDESYGEIYKDSAGQLYDNYRPIGTEWDHAPKKETYGWDAVCSTVNSNGRMFYWNTKNIGWAVNFNETGKWFKKKSEDICMACGICPDKSRYENGAWKTSLRERPFWAKGEK